MWTDAAIETLRQMALEGKSASSIAMALGAPSRNAVIGKANRIGVKLTGHIHCVAPRASRPSTETRDRPHRRSSMEASRCSRCPARAKACMGLRPGPGRGDVEARGDRRKQLPMADWRPDKRGIRLLRHSDGEGPLLLRRSLPDGLQAAEFAGVGRAALRGPRIDGGCLKPQLAGLLARSRMGARARGSVSRGRDLFVCNCRLSPHRPCL
jgi:hypothetical protein